MANRREHVGDTHFKKAAFKKQAGEGRGGGVRLRAQVPPNSKQALGRVGVGLGDRDGGEAGARQEQDNQVL